VKAYLLNIATALSQLLSVLTGGHPDLTLSARVYVASRTGSTVGLYLETVLDAVYWFHPNHCFKSWLEDVQHASRVFTIQREILRGAGR
jgi:hypothetical protein